jgi:hypothetical protein
MDAELAALAEEVADEDILALDNVTYWNFVCACSELCACVNGVQGPVRSTVQPTVALITL